MGRPVVHWEIWSKDAKKVGEFYQKLFDWNVNFVPGLDYHLVETGGQGGINGGIFTPKPGTLPASLPYMTFYVEVDDLQAYLDKAEKLGGKIAVPPMPIPGVGSFAMFNDPEGNCVGIYKRG